MINLYNKFSVAPLPLRRHFLVLRSNWCFWYSLRGATLILHRGMISLYSKVSVAPLPLRPIWSPQSELPEISVNNPCRDVNCHICCSMHTYMYTYHKSYICTYLQYASQLFQRGTNICYRYSRLGNKIGVVMYSCPLK